MPSSHHLLSSCTNTSLGPPSLPKSTTLTQQPLKFMNGLLSTPTPTNYRLINTASLLHPCMLVSQLSHMMLFARYGSPLPWYMSYMSDSYQVCTSDGTVYHYMRWHLHECRVKPADTVPDATAATPQAPARPHVSMPQSAPAKPAQPAQPTPVAPTMPVTPKPQTTAVPTTPDVPRVAPASTPVTPSVAPLLPRRLGQAHVAPKHLIQEIWPYYFPWEETPDSEHPQTLSLS